MKIKTMQDIIEESSKIGFDEFIKTSPQKKQYVAIGDLIEWLKEKSKNLDNMNILIEELEK